MKHLSPSSSSSSHELEELVLRSDEARASSLQSRIKHAYAAGSSPDLYKQQQQQQEEEGAAAEIPLTSGVALQTMNYVVTVGLGRSRRRNMAVIVDTGSDLTWVQCRPCASCYAQQSPLYDPSTSTSYHPVPCNSTYCTTTSLLLQPGACGGGGGSPNSSAACDYSVSYGDGSYTRGVLALDQLGLGGTNVERFVFGCGRSNRGLFGGTSGLLGLGRTPLSLISQTRARFGGVFSYCLPSKASNSSGNLVLGDDPSSYKNRTPIAYTRMVPGPPQAPFYVVNQTGMRVGGVVLGFGRGVRVLVDSGTVITRLVPSVYDAVRAEFSKQFSGYPAAPGFSILDTCFDLSGYDYVKVPKLALWFDGGAEMSVDVAGIFYSVKKDGSQVCLAMTRLPDEDAVGIVGNFQQRNQRVVYDTAGSRVGFGQESCSYI